MTRGAKALFDREISKYRSYLIERASGYADQDDNLEINDRHISNAVRDYQNDYYYETRNNIIREEWLKKVQLMTMFVTVCLFLFVIVAFLINRGELGNSSAEILSVIGALISTGMVGMTFITSQERRKSSIYQQRIVEYLNKWNEVESLLRRLYKKKKHENAKSIRDLLNFYRELAAEKDNSLENSIVRLLNLRNNIVHRGIKEVNYETLEGLILEMDNVIKDLKDSE